MKPEDPKPVGPPHEHDWRPYISHFEHDQTGRRGFETRERVTKVFCTKCKETQEV